MPRSVSEPQGGRALGCRDTACLRPAPRWFRGTRASRELAEWGVRMLGAEGLCELPWQPSVPCASAQHPLAVALLCKRRFQQVTAVTQGSACGLCSLLGSSSSSLLPLSVLSLSPGSLSLLCQAVCKLYLWSYGCLLSENTLISSPIPRDRSLMSSMT